MKPNRGPDAWIGFDLDGSIAKQSEKYKWGEIGEPIKPMILFMKSLLKKGETVKIFTARVDNGEKSQIPQIQDWLEEQGLPRLEVTNVKDRHMKELYDDRAYNVVHNKGKIIRPS